MGLRTVNEYKESLKDGRIVYLCGKKIEDVTTDPMLKVGVDTAGVDYEMAEMPEFRDLATVTLEDGERISRHYYTPKNGEDLLKRHELMVASTRLAGGIIPFTKDVSGDSMNAVNITANMMGKPEYSKRAESYRRHLQKNDLSVACAMTDVKGDRHLHPSDPRQKHPDYYVHVVAKNDEGITVRGAKAHITAAAYCDEILVLPCRNMREKDADYAVSFAVPANAKGIRHICHPIGEGMKTSSELDFPVDIPARMHTDSLIIFDDVFVPWERVFLCGEWQFAMFLVYNFAYMHRHTAASYRIPISEVLVGMAQAAAEYNGIENYSHVREKMTDLLIYLNTLKSLARASCLDYVVHEGIPIPNPVISNIAKYEFASKYHEAARAVQDIAGGIVVTAPTYKDYQNPEEREDIEKYLGGKAEISTEDRLRMLQLIRRMTASEMGGFLEVVALHAEGSLASQRMMVYGESSTELQEYKKLAEIAAGIKVESPPELPEYKKLYESMKGE